MPPSPKLEIRNLATRIELRARAAPEPDAETEAEEEAEAGGTLVGYASRFDDPFQPYWDWEDYTEIVHRDAFTRTLREMPDVRALRNHDSNLVLARGKNGTLRLKVDATGLGFEVDLNPETTLGRDTQADVMRGDIDGCSIGFCVVVDDVVSDRETGRITRTILDVDLFEITPACTFPANESTTVELRSKILRRVQPITYRPRLTTARALRQRIDL